MKSFIESSGELGSNLCCPEFGTRPSDHLLGLEVGTGEALLKPVQNFHLIRYIKDAIRLAQKSGIKIELIYSDFYCGIVDKERAAAKETTTFATKCLEPPPPWGCEEQTIQGIFGVGYDLTEKRAVTTTTFFQEREKFGFMTWI